MESNSSSPPRILYAENDATTRELFQSFFGRLGWHYDVVSGVGQVLDCVSNAEYDVVISNYSMPQLTGAEMLRSVRKTRPDQAVIVVTGASSVSELIAMLREGAADVFQRPVDFDSLERSVKRLVTEVRQRGAEESLYRYVLEERTTLVFSSTQLAEIKVPLGIGERLLRAGKIDINTKLKLELAFQEALTNGFEHGNLELRSEWKEIYDQAGLDRYSVVKKERLKDPHYASRYVTVTVHLRDDVLEIAIRDQGQGFTRESLSLSGGTGLQGHGRGLAIITTVMDEVTYNESGTEIRMKKHLCSEPTEICS